MNALLHAAAGYDVEDGTDADGNPPPEPVPCAGTAGTGGSPPPENASTRMERLLREAIRGH
jgi:hypothetical protein